MLDAEEYLYLAINASQTGNHHASLEYLHKCLKSEPDNSQAIYLLAAEHAELGLFNRAIEGMERALDLNPAMEMASFQLGMLYFRKEDNQKAANLWTQLKNNSSDPALQNHASALLELLSNNHSGFQDYVSRGLAFERDNIALAGIMRNIMAEVSRNTAQQSATTESSTGIDASQDEKPTVFLGAYKDKMLSDEQ